MHSFIRRALGLTLLATAMSWLAGCAHPISAEKATPSLAYREATANALGGRTYSSETRLVLHRFDLVERFRRKPAETLQWLHDRALVDDRNDLLFALAELSYLHGENLYRTKAAHDYFLCSAIYAHHYLVSHGRQRSDLFDPRIRIAIDLYNRALARGFVPPGDTNGVVVLKSGPRPLPPGTVKVEFSQPGFPLDLKRICQFVPADDFVVRGLTVRNQQAGLGAPLIGLGFGMQTMLKNFVSGIIILFKRPFRVGDVLDVGGQHGTVTGVGLRASVLQLWDGTETLIPNGTLLENNLTNWTYSNRKVRFSVSVGVAYGSDPRRIIQLLEEVAGRHGLMEPEPKPQVQFTEFGDSTLTFELRFWIDVAKANSAQVSSDLRLMIAGSFAEHGIVIDFPQRDNLLHSARPIQVQVVPGAAGPAGDGAKPNRTEAGDKPGAKP